jgi:putative DNA primase/helicase
MTQYDLAAWKECAKARDILEVAQQLGAKLRRAGGEWVGPCPLCGGTDRFGINTRKQIFICRGAGGGDVIALVEHVHGDDFFAACEFLTGELPPDRRREETEPERRERQRRWAEQRAAAERERQRREKQEAASRKFHAETARGIWREALPIKNTPAETYLRRRGIDFDLSPFKALRFAELPYPVSGKTLGDCPVFPCLVAAVVGHDLKLTAVWRVFLEPEGTDKLAVARRGLGDSAKLGLGPASGGAVWLGRPAGSVNIAEGLETALGVVGLTSGRVPVAATLSTSGMAGFVPPPDVTGILIWPDADRDRVSIRAGTKRIQISPGLKSGRDLLAKLGDSGITATMQRTPANGQDWLDVYNAAKTGSADGHARR